MDNRFRPLELHLSFSQPDRLTDVTSWHEHIPFAMALVSVVRPRVLVELGTHRGDSYSAMCQAVDALGIATRCYAVDTWRGDEHAGAYGDEILEELRAYHDPRYGRFSTLVRSTFDEAVGHFPDGAIDLLHVDGLHTEEAVRHDFETWRPKLSPRAVVIFHDTNVRERGFGVWRFWEEERSRHPSFEFSHGHGLGLLAVGPEAPPEILALCALAEDERRAVSRFYEALGERVAQVRRLRTLADRERAGAAALAQRDERLRQLEQETSRLVTLDRALTRSEDRVRELEEDAAHLHEVLARVVREGRTGHRLARAWRRLVARVRRDGVFGTRGPIGRKLARRRRRRELRLLRRSGLFDAAWYASSHPDVVAAGVDPLSHYYDHGAAEGRDPNRWFATAWYLERAPEVAASGVNPLVHYVKRGARELRDPHPRFSAVRYLVEHPELEREGVNPLAHFLRTGGRRSGSGATPLPDARDDDDHGAGAAADARALLASGAMNAGWYGGVRLEQAGTGEPPLSERAAARIDAADTRAIIRYATPPAGSVRGDDAAHGGAPSALARALAPLDAIEAHLAAVTADHVPARADGPPSFTILTPFFRHRRHFDACAASVEHLLARSAGYEVEWIVVNDDPSFTAEDLAAGLGDGLRAVTRFLSDGRNLGIVRRLNEGIAAARHEWILFLDCDDLVAAEAVETLGRYIARFPRCRYVSSAVVDIAESGDILRFRRRTAGPARLLADGMTAGHLKAIRRDAFDAHGPLDPAFDGCQDYELALRMAFEEPLLYVPEYLYYYRWHRASQSVAQGAKQSATADALVRRYARRFLEECREAGEPPCASVAPPRELPRRGVAVMRTLGTRNELLAEALGSLALQDPPVSPVVVVHGEQGALEGVERLVRELGSDATVLHAPELGRLRGYPLNVALRHILAPERRAEEPGFLFFLDDDDVVYPAFSRKMHETLSATSADVVHAASNRRVPWQPAEPAYAPLPAACLLVRNFIPINAYAIRFSALREAGLEFSEELSVVEDWDFLVRALGAGLRFFPLADTLSEFRVIGDGNRAAKRDGALWADCEARVRARGAEVLRAQTLPLLDHLLAFPPELLAGASDADRALVLAVRGRLADPLAGLRRERPDGRPADRRRAAAE